MLRTGLSIFFFVWLTIPGKLQEVPAISTERQTPDPNNAMIEGRVTLPSGSSADFNIKVMLSNSRNMLTTFYTNKHGEFRFPDLSAGVYYVQVTGDAKLYEPVTETVRLTRSQILRLTIALRNKEETAERQPSARLVSISELKQQVPQAAQKEYAQAMKLANKGKLPQAIEGLRRAIALYPDYLDAHNDLGAQYLKLKRLDEAAAQFRLVLEKHPKYFNSRYNLGLVLLEQKNYAEAIAQLNQAIALDSTRPTAHLWLGIAFWHTGQLPAAERQLSKALIMGGPDAVVAHYYLAQIYLKREDAVEAARALRIYLEEAAKGEYAAEARQMLKKLEASQAPVRR